MSLPRTEQMNPASLGLDILPDSDALSILYDCHLAAVVATRAALPNIALAANQVATSLKNGGRLIYVGAGSSGLMALSDGLELPGTFGISADQIVILISEGLDQLHRFSSVLEDDGAKAAKDIVNLKLTKKDSVVIVSASGSTPYCLAALEVAHANGAHTISLANNDDSPLLHAADIPIHINTLPEVIAGSTRMGAATAQKTALNLMSTLVGIRLGHVHDGYMVNVQAGNKKLKSRSTRIVSNIAKCDEKTAENSLKTSKGSVKCAVLIAKGVTDLHIAEELLEKSDYKIRKALTYIEKIDNMYVENA